MLQFIQEHSFGLLISYDGTAPVATHLPFVVQKKGQATYLVSHMALANSQWQHLFAEEVLCVFSGPHGYISPSWYEEWPNVPTWNYVAVHAYGRAEKVPSDEVRSILSDMIAAYDPTSPLSPHLGEDFYEKMVHGIMPFYVKVERLEGKAKLSQNKSRTVQEKVLVALEKEPKVEETLVSWHKRVLAGEVF